MQLRAIRTVLAFRVSIHAVPYNKKPVCKSVRISGWASNKPSSLFDYAYLTFGRGFFTMHDCRRAFDRAGTPESTAYSQDASVQVRLSASGRGRGLFALGPIAKDDEECIRVIRASA